jgi:diketogulonate reductase-like aldo/keto reductase
VTPVLDGDRAVLGTVERSGTPRRELFVTASCGVQDVPAVDSTKRAFESSLTRLGVGYLDLYLIHHEDDPATGAAGEQAPAKPAKPAEPGRNTKSTKVWPTHDR